MTTNPTGQEALIERLQAMVSDDGRAITCNGRTTREMCADILAAAEALSSTPESKTPSREEIARVIDQAMRDADVPANALVWSASSGASNLALRTADTIRAMLSSSPNKGEG